MWTELSDHFVDPVKEKKSTYVGFVKLVSGNLLAMFRTGPTGTGDENLLRYDYLRGKWTELYSPFVDGKGSASPYFWKAVVSPKGEVHLAWTWRLAVREDTKQDVFKPHFSGFPNQDICYAVSPDEGDSWYGGDGKKYDMPITRARADVIQEIKPGESFFNHFGADHDGSGNPHFVYTRWGDADSRIPQQWHLHKNGNEWESGIITNYRTLWKWTIFQQDGYASTYVSRPSVAVKKDGTALVLSRTREFSNIIELYMSRAGNYRSWTRNVILNQPAGGWEAQYDSDLWHDRQVLNILAAGITDKTVRAVSPRWYFREAWNKTKKAWKYLLALGEKMLYGKITGKPDRVYFYSGDYSLPVQNIGPLFKNNTGYILEVSGEF